MYRRILLPLDLADRHRPVLDRAAELCEPASGWVALLHVIETIHDVSHEELAGFYRSLRERAERLLQESGDELRKLGIDVRTEIVLGRRASEILRYARDLECDLIVMRSHVPEPDRPGGGLGTLSHQVALFSHCTVLLVK